MNKFLPDLSLFASTRFYSTTNVLRTKDDEVKSAVLENTIGASLATKPIQTEIHYPRTA